ncbi:MAG TPA: hypothetical protein VFG08_08590, partial [Candidatus Polarisedimenticolia bacterium]|nr:hypothetical protein [Candidatus Polarisedimenticolia bacterium]
SDCVPFACADFHRALLDGRVVMIGCPKLDDAGFYRDKLRIRGGACETGTPHWTTVITGPQLRSRLLGPGRWSK